MNRFRPGPTSKGKISPGVEGARHIQLSLLSAVNVLMKNDSPPIIRLSPPNSPPPPMRVFISMPCWATIAPGSALMDSPALNCTVSRL